MTRALVTSLILLTLPAAARADVLAPPPASCPEGSSPVSCHGPSTCRIDDCSATGCPSGQICVSRDLCVREHCCNGRGCGTMPVNYDHVAGACGPGGACADFGAACESRRVCVPLAAGMDGGAPDGGAPDGGAIDGGRVDGGRVDAGSVDAGSVDAGSVDGGGLDAGATDDAGAAGDAGTAAVDAGAMDAGPSPVDAGPPGGTAGGGCCSVYGRGSPLGGALAGMLLALAALRLRRRG